MEFSGQKIYRELMLCWYAQTRVNQPALPGSERGSQHCGHEFQSALNGYGMQSSMGRKGDCCDKAPKESLWVHLKVARLHGKRFATRRDAVDAVIDWRVFYNSTRLHQRLDYVSPTVFEEQLRAAQKQSQEVA
jgi:putative transposase